MGDGGVACAPSQRATERFVHTEARCKAFAPKPFGRMRKGEQASEPDRKEELGMEKGRRLEGKTERSELEKGEFPAERHQKEGVEPGEWRNEDSKKGGFVLESWWKGDRERKQEREKDGSGWSDQRHRTRHSSKLEVSSHERDRKSCSRANEEEWSQYKYEHNNGKSHGKDSCSGSWPKWPSMESESSSCKHHEEFSGFSGLKSRHISGERNWSNHSEKSSTTISSSSSRVLSAYRHSSSRNHESRLVRSPGHTDPPSYDRAHRHDYRDRASRLHERSPHDRARHHHLKDIFPIYLELSPHDGSRAMEQREQNRKCYVSENLQNGRNDEKLLQRNSIGRNTHKNSSARTSNNSSSSRDRSADDKCIKERKSLNFSEEPSESPPPPPPPPFPLPQVNGRIEEQPSMEEDMDICDTPPHVAEQADTNLGKWCYLDHFGVERGTTKLADLKRLVEEGILLSDHLIKHADSNRWVTIENATSPLVSLNLPSIVSDAVTWKVSPPEAAGKFSVDTDFSHEEPISLTRQELHPDHSSVSPEFIEDLRIDERVAALLNGYTVTRGKELESIGEALKSNFVYTDLDKWDQSEGFTRSRPRAYDLSTHVRDGKRGRAFEGASKEAAQTRLGPSYEKENLVLSVESTNWFDGRWSCKGGDWKGNDEASQGRSFKTRQVLNEGFPLCLRTKSWCEDPRGHRKDDLYQTPYIRKLDLPPWAFTWTEDKNEGDTSEIVANGFGQIKPSVTKAVKGTLLPVIKINAHVVKDQGTVEPRIRLRSSEHHTPRSSRSYSSSGDKTWLSDTSFHSKKPCEHDLQSMHKCTTVLNAPKDHVCTVDELSLHLGNWYYLDGAGHEHGPSTYAELEELAAKGTILKHSSVFRKDDNMWFPITSNARAIGSVHNQEENLRVHSCSADCHSLAHSDISTASRSFHNSHPQFIGYTRGKLHELIMKFYKNREFAAAINQVLDPWMSLRQPTNEMDKHLSFNSSIMKSSAVLTHDSSVNEFWKSEDGSGTANNRPGKRARLLSDESVGGFEMKEDICQEHESSFDDLLCESAFPVDNVGNPEAENESWSLLNVHVLARIFHFLRKDVKSLLFAGATCKCWKSAIIFYKGIANQVDFSSIGANCTDCMVRSIMNGYEKKSIRSVVLAGCSNISVNLLKDILRLFPFMASIDIRGCSQFKNVDFKYQNVKWLKDINSPETNNLEESHSKIRSLLQIRDKSCSLSNDSKGLSSNLGKSDEHFGFFKKEPYSGRKDTSSHPLRQGYYNGKRLDDARKSSAAVSRSSHMRQLMLSNQYKEMEEFIASSLNDIVRKNPLEFFRVKVAQIEDRMRSGFYARSCGLDTVKEDIRRMCWDALKIKNQGSAAEMNQLMMSFMQLLKSLDENPKSSFERDEKIRPLKNDSGSRLNSSISKYGRKVSKTLSEKGGMNKGNNKFYDNGRTDYGTYVFECEGKRKLSKLKKMDSDSEISDDLSGDVKGADERNNSDTESDLDIHSRAGIGDVKGIQYSMMDETLDSISDDREWGARMTKAGLVPPVTRKYEVIDRYVIVADADEVRKKMQVSLPEDYAEKLVAQKSSKQESDMELPEVKEYKPRKVLGEEVLEQEVYGIDPYTHNLLFDSMPEEQECPIVDKHKFIEEVLLCALNKQVRPFTGCGNTPMVYPLQPVIKQIRETAEEEGDIHVMKICLAILKAIQNRPDDNYVAYRKGLGVVCNKEEGFGVDDFVVEFLGEVYPVWRWYEKQDGIRSLQKNNKDPVPEFYNINLERPKGDRDGYDLVVVDAMHKANYASRICHSCRPNCEAKLTAVDGQYQIGIYTVRPISYGEEVTFDYNSVTESKDEYEASVCLCGSQVCRGSYLNLTGEGAFQKVLKDCHGMLDRHKLMLEACEVNFVSQEDYIDLRTAGLGNCLLSGLPDWLVTYSAHLVRFINLERTMLPEEILKHNVEEKKKFFSDICLEIEKHDAEVQAEGVYNARLQNIAITLDKVRHVMTCVFGNAKTAPPPLKKLNPEAAVSVLWKGEGSLVEELLQCMAPHMEENFLETLKSKIHAHDPSGSGDLQKELKKSLLWLRDELRNLPCTYKCRHDAAADLIHLYAYTKCFFKIQEYKTVKSPPVYISPLDLGPKHANKMESGFQEYCKTYGENYCLGQLIYWHCQTNVDPDCHLSRARRGCLSLPDVSSFYAKSQKSLHEHVYGSRTMRFMLSRMERQPQRPWPRDRLWVFKGSPKFFGSPMLDAVLNKCPLDKEMVHWLRSRPNVFHGT